MMVGVPPTMISGATCSVPVAGLLYEIPGAVSSILNEMITFVPIGVPAKSIKALDAVTVTDSLTRLKDMIEKAHEQGLSLADAVANALALEKSLLEAEYFEVFEGTAAEVVQVQYCLADAARDHYDRIREMLSSAR